MTAFSICCIRNKWCGGEAGQSPQAAQAHRTENLPHPVLVQTVPGQAPAELFPIALGDSLAPGIESGFYDRLVIQTRKLRHVPVILYDSRYWMGLVSWLGETMLGSGKISLEDPELLLLSDDAKEML